MFNMLKKYDFYNSQVKVEFFKNNQVVAWMTFNGSNTDKMNWFSKSNLAQSGFNDLGSRSTFNYFSIAG